MKKIISTTLLTFGLLTIVTTVNAETIEKISAPLSSKACKGEYFDDVVQEFKNAGFTKVEVKRLDDLIIGFLHSDGEVSKVEVNNSTSFKKGDQFDKDQKIIVTYHNYESSDQEPLSLNMAKEFDADENGKITITGETEKNTEISYYFNSDSETLKTDNDGKFQFNLTLDGEDDENLQITLKKKKKNRYKNLTLHQNDKVIEKIQESRASSEASSRAQAEAAAQEKERQDNYNNTHPGYVVDFYDYKTYYILDTENKQIAVITKYNDSNSPASVDYATYTGDMSTAIEFTLDFGDGGSYPMRAYNTYRGAIFAGTWDGSENKASVVNNPYSIAKQYLGV